MEVMLWERAMYSSFNARTVVRINTIDLAPNAPAKLDELRNDLDEWYNNLRAIKQNLYADVYEKLGIGQ